MCHSISRSTFVNVTLVVFTKCILNLSIGTLEVPTTITANEIIGRKYKLSPLSLLIDFFLLTKCENHRNLNLKVWHFTIIIVYVLVISTIVVRRRGIAVG